MMTVSELRDVLLHELEPQNATVEQSDMHATILQEEAPLAVSVPVSADSCNN